MKTKNFLWYTFGIALSRLSVGATLKIYKGGSHGICTIEKNRVNEDLLAFIKG